MRTLFFTLCLALASTLAPTATAQSSDQDPARRATGVPALAPPTKPERTDHAETSTNADVDAFLAVLRELPHAGRLKSTTFGTTTLGKPMRLVIASLDPSRTAEDFRAGDRLRALILANIHGGEVEGKEAVQAILREIAHGEHTDLLATFDLFFVPVFNADGNDLLSDRNRVSQNGPDRGVGERHNAMDRDLNRDYVKAETPEVRAQLRLFNRIDPHLYMDLHTTNGSEHAYHLTYAPGLSTSNDPELDAFGHDEFMPRIRAAMAEKHGFRTFDYGNFPNRRRGESGELGWFTYDHKPRLGWNYAGLRNRLSVLSEAYSYQDFATRIAVTRAFVLENLRALAAFEDRARALFARADHRVTATGAPRVLLGYDSDFAAPVRQDVVVTTVDRLELPDGRGTRLVAGDQVRTLEDVPVHVRFEPRRAIAFPDAWVFANAATLEPGALDHVRQTLLIHGVECTTLTEPVAFDAEVFWPTAVAKPRMVYQGHRMLRIRGALEPGKRTVPVGSLVVPGRQRLARVAAMLLDPMSEDSLAIWNFFDSAVQAVEAPGDDDAPLAFPVLRATQLPANLPVQPCDLEQETGLARVALPAPPAGTLENAVTIRIVCTDRGQPRAGGFEDAWPGRKVHYEIGPKRVETLAEVAATLTTLRAAQGDLDTAVITPLSLVLASEARAAADAAAAAGFEHLYLQVSKRE